MFRVNGATVMTDPNNTSWRILVVQPDPTFGTLLRQGLDGRAPSAAERQNTDALKKRDDGAAVFGTSSIEPFSIDTAENVVEAVELLAHARIGERPYAVVFLDGSAEGADDPTALDTLREADSQVELVVVGDENDFAWQQLSEGTTRTCPVAMLRRSVTWVEASQFTRVLAQKWECARSARLLADRQTQNTDEHSQRIRQHRDFSNRLIEASAAYICVTTLDGVVRTMNPTMLRAVGCTLEEVAGKNFHDGFLRSSEDSAGDQLQELLRASHNPIRFESPLQSKAGRQRDVAWGVTALDRNEREGLLLWVGIDISERIRADEALRESQNLLQSVLNAVPELLIVVDRSHKVITSNWMGYEHLSAEERSRDVPCYERFRQRKTPCPNCLLEEVFANATTTRQENEDPATGAVYEIVASPIVNDEGVVTCVVKHLRDVTHRALVERELRAYTCSLENTNRAVEEFYLAAEATARTKSEFLANMSHEIRTPLTAILGFAETLLAPGSNRTERVSAVETIQRNGEHLLEIINDILDLSKIEAGKLQVERIACSPAQVIQDVAALMSLRAEEKKLTLIIDYATSLPITIESDPTRLRQILLNLVSNAIKFTDQGSVRLCVSLEEDEGDDSPRLRFEVIDTGIGMTDDQVAKLFQPFSQADNSTSRRFGGTGLGLAICMRLTHSLGGEIGVDSEPNRGSRFWFTTATGPLDDVPRLSHPEEDSVNRTQTVDEKKSTLGDICHQRILLAEDAPDNQRLLSVILQKAGAEVIIAENGQVAVEKAFGSCTDNSHGVGFDLILMDMQMPVVDGYEATRTLRQRGYSGPIVALTANAMAEDAEKCLDAGCNGYLSKPVKRDILLAAVAKYVRLPAVMSGR